MSTLSELNTAVKKLDDLWLVCPDLKQKEQILTERDKLDAQAAALANLTLKDGTKALDDAIKALNKLTKIATKAKKEIDIVGKSIEKTAEALSKATVATVKVAAYIATL
jgi:predicted nucleotide-binding protein (sugar kinase/HSP70/actin superfamily)